MFKALTLGWVRFCFGHYSLLTGAMMLFSHPTQWLAYQNSLFSCLNYICNEERRPLPTASVMIGLSKRYFVQLSQLYLSWRTTPTSYGECYDWLVLRCWKRLRQLHHPCSSSELYLPNTPYVLISGTYKSPHLYQPITVCHSPVQLTEPHSCLQSEVTVWREWTRCTVPY
jgi:hypothetical protein